MLAQRYPVSSEMSSSVIYTDPHDGPVVICVGYPTPSSTAHSPAKRRVEMAWRKALPPVTADFFHTTTCSVKTKN
ncbi:hypothetical protein NDU88_010461 [Pleurodeles waltl]|uniref:Uncharacterized protein n=1 Tax=Pleurodeles waltl TaxID=8319 RepID=A0AAV7QWI5_PLEWA|nr:hypothetical protein NDU88_010461 [Pleurodeles waltl]